MTESNNELTENEVTNLMFNDEETKGNISCSFCGKSQDQVKKIVAGPGVYICNECVDLCQEIMEEEFSKQSFDGEMTVPKPFEIREILNDYIIGQESAKKALSVAVYNHYKRVNSLDDEDEDDIELQKSNICLIGPTGSGRHTLRRRLLAS